MVAEIKYQQEMGMNHQHDEDVLDLIHQGGGAPTLEVLLVEVQEGARSAICHALRGCRTICWHHFESTKTRELKRKEKSWQEEPGGLEE